jgi:P27 family predicted phage terminase small subunit
VPAGRKRKPAAQRAAEGNPGHRAIPTPLDFTGAGEIPGPPTWLNAAAKKEYKRIVAALSNVDTLRATDRGIVTSYAVNHARWEAAEKTIAAEGTVVKVTGSQGQEKWIKHPALAVAAEAQMLMIRAGSLLGLNPVDRNKISAAPKVADDPFDSF